VGEGGEMKKRRNPARAHLANRPRSKTRAKMPPDRELVGMVIDQLFGLMPRLLGVREALITKAIEEPQTFKLPEVCKLPKDVQ
jgi:hypothetical protein